MEGSFRIILLRLIQPFPDGGDILLFGDAVTAVVVGDEPAVGMILQLMIEVFRLLIRNLLIAFAVDEQHRNPDLIRPADR